MYPYNCGKLEFIVSYHDAMEQEQQKEGPMSNSLIPNMVTLIHITRANQV